MAGYIGSGVVSLSTTGADIDGNITVDGTVDGRDVSVDGTKLDGIEASSTADQTKADIEGLGIDVPAANLTGTVAAARLSTAATQAESDASTKIATTAYVSSKLTTLIGGAPSTLNDLNELAAAINDDANYNSTLTTALATKLPLAGGALTGAVTGTTASFTRLDINATNTKLKGDLLANSDGAFDIGASGASRPRNLYLSNSIVAGDITTTGVGAFGGSVTVGTTVNTSGTVTVKHTDGVANVSLSPTSTGGVVNVRNASGVGVVTLDGRNSKVTVAGAILAGTDVGVEGSTGKPVMQNAAGSVSFPSYTFYGDGNTGMYRIGSDVIGFGTAGAERVRIDSTGIAFHGDTATANHLNDYEEGSYDVSIVMASGTCTVATNYNGMKYTKIGRMVTVQGQIRVSSVSNPSGLMKLSLPFAIDQTNDEGRNISGCVPRMYQASVPSGGLYPYLATVFNIGAYAQLEWVRNNATTINHVPAADEYYIINFSYFTA